MSSQSIEDFFKFLLQHIGSLRFEIFELRPFFSLSSEHRENMKEMNTAYVRREHTL